MEEFGGKEDGEVGDAQGVDGSEKDEVEDGGREVEDGEIPRGKCRVRG